MEFLIRVQSISGGWEVAATNLGTGVSLLAAPRRLEALGEAPAVFPLPPLTERPPVLAGTSSPPDFIEEYFGKWVTQLMNEAEMRHFGQYLFAVLLGDTLWQSLTQAAGDSGVQLILSWSRGETALTRLPWEMMCRGDRFLMAEDRYALTRQVAGAAHAVEEITAPPRVLFVVGSHANDAALRPGAEYLGLLRGLRHAGLGLKHHLILQATTTAVVEAIKSFQPSVVHFICHGEIGADGQGYLRLVDEMDSTKFTKVDASQLYALLRPPLPPAVAGAPPPTARNLAQILMITACYSASSGGSALNEVGQIAFPLAVELVTQGIPIVVGMAGEIADQACRLFTRKFYEALLTTGDLAAATAWGRRAGILPHLGSVRSRIDWTLPTLFISEGSRTGSIPVRTEPTDQVWHEVAEDFFPAKFPVCCGRFELSKWQDLLLSDYGFQRKAGGLDADLQILGVAVRGEVKDVQYGRSWVLQDAARRALREGHVPCLLARETFPNMTPPRNLRDLILSFLRAARYTVQMFNIRLAAPLVWAKPFEWSRILLTASEANPKPTPFPAGLPSEIQNHYFTGEAAEWSDAIASAFLLDMKAFFELILALRPPTDRMDSKLVVLIDDVHQMGDATGALLNQLLGPYGLRAMVQARVVLTYVSEGKSELQPAVDSIIDFLGRNFAHNVPLGKFAAPMENRLAYEHFLLHWQDEAGIQRPFAPVQRTSDTVDWFFRQMEHFADSIPSNLKGARVRDFMKSTLDMPPGFLPLRPADDDDALAKTR